MSSPLTGVLNITGTTTGAATFNTNTVGFAITHSGGSTTSSGLVGINNASTLTAAATISGNTLNFSASKTAGTITSTYAGITNTASTPGGITFNANKLNGISSVATGALIAFSSSYGTAQTATVAMTNNEFKNGTTSASSGNFLNPNTSVNSVTVTGNTFDNVTWNSGTGAVYGYYNIGGPGTGTATITGNTFSNLALSGTMAFYGFYHNTTSSQTTNISSNTLNTAITTASGNATGITLLSGLNSTLNSNLITLSATGTGNVFGIAASGSTTTLGINSNTISVSSATGTGTIYGISATSGVPQTLASNTITAVSSKGTSQGIYLGGSSTHSVSLNTIGGITTSSTSSSDQAVGIYFNSGGTTTDIFQNTVDGVSVTGATGSAKAYGYTSATGTSTTISLYRNKVVNISNAQAGTVSATSATGIYLNGQNVRAYNNLIGAITAPASVGNVGVIGINAQGSNSNAQYLYFNTVSLSGTSSATGFGSAGVYFGVATSSSVYLRGNIVVNKSTPTGTTAAAVALRRSSGTTGSAPSNLFGDYNLYYAGTPGTQNLIYAEGSGTTYTNALPTLAQYKALLGSSYEANSKTEDVPFQTATTGQAGYLHIAPTTPTIVESGGPATTTTFTVSNDYDGDTRGSYPLAGQANGGGTAPDLGADEGDFTPIAIDVAPTVFVAPVQTSGCMSNSTQTVTVTVKNNGASATTAPISVSGTVSYNGGAAVSLGSAVTVASLAGGAQTNVDLTTSYNMSAAGTYVFTVSVTGGGDQYAGNNTLTSSTYTVTTPTVGTLSITSPVSATFCGSTPTSVTLSLTTATNASGVQFQQSTDGGTTFTNLGAPVTPATPTTYTATGVTQTTSYRAVAVCNTLSSANSNTVTVTNQQPVIAITTTPTSGAVCAGSSATLTATATPASRTITGSVVFNATFNTGADGFTTTTAGSKLATAFTRQSPGYGLGSAATSYNGPSSTESSAGSAFYVADSDKAGTGTSPTTSTTLISPVFSLVNYTAATLTFDQYYRRASTVDVTIVVELSTDGGATYPNSLVSQSANQGSSATPGTSTPSISLTSYVGQSNLRIRFRYVTDNGWYWAIDNVKVAGTYTDNATFAWTPAASIASGANSATATTTALAATTTFTVTANYPVTGCSNTKQVTIKVPALASPNNTNITCNGGSDGTITAGINAADGTGPYKFEINANGTGFTTAVASQAAGSYTYTALAAGSYVVRVTDLGAGTGGTGCAVSSGTITLTQPVAPTVNAGSSPANICVGNTYTTTGTYGGAASSATYTSSGTGTFTNGGVINGATPSVTYTPSAADISAGSVTLTLTSAGQPAGCPAATATLPLTIGSSSTWMGTNGTNWFDAGNWSACVPTRTIDATIPAGLANYPNLTTTATAEVRTLTLVSGSSLSESAGTLNIYGNLANNAAATLNLSGGMVGFLGATSTVANPVTFFNLTTNLSSASSTVALSGNNTVSNSVTMTKGLLTTGGILTMGPTATITETNDFYVTGQVATQRPLTAGTANDFGGLGLVLTPAAGSASPGSTTVTRTTGTTLTGVGTSRSVQRYFDIVPTTNTGLNVQMDFTLFNHENTNNISAASFKLYKSDNGASGPWQSQAFTTTAMVSGGYTVTKTGIIDFSTWTVGDGNNPLPVSLTRFEAVRQDQNAALSWTTASETDNAGFEVQVSLDGTAFRQLGFVAAASPSSLTARSYSLLDREPEKYGLRYYRLRQLDLGGKGSFSVVRTVAFGQGASLSAAPNPFGETLTLHLQAPVAAASLPLTLTDALGRVVLRQTVDVPAGASQLTLPGLASLPTGMYVLQLPLGGQVRTVKLVKQ